MDNKEYKRKIFNDEFGQKDDYSKLKLGIVLFLIVVTIVGAIWTYVKNIEVQEEQKKIEASKLAWQQYYQSVEYQKQQQDYKRKLDEYNRSIPIPLR